MSDTDQSPIRRFPWAQLVLCIVCLVATAWTCLRYSYAWDMRASGDASAWRKLYVKYDAYGEFRGTIRKIGSLDGKSHRYAVSRNMRCGLRCLFNDDWPPCFFFTRKVERLDVGQKVVLKGRLVEGRFKDLTGHTRLGPVILPNASRFHGGFIAGIVIGAVGCLIFWSYLRRWQRARFLPPGYGD